jgi:hypothetical protein
MTDDGVSRKKMMQLLAMPLTEQEEAVLALMKQINALEHENFLLKEDNKRLLWSLTEHD